MRYAFMGPMETIHLNAEGTQNYCDRYGEVRPKYPICVSMIPNKFMKNANQQFRIRLSRSQTIYNVSSDLGPIPTGWKQETEKDKAEVEIQKHYGNTDTLCKYKIQCICTKNKYENKYTTTRWLLWRQACVLQCPWRISTREGESC